jgi:hypothetical protein
MAAAAAAMNSPPPSTMRAASIPPSGRSIATSADDNADEAGYRFSTERFRPGEYVSIREQDEEMRTFRIITVQDVA